MDYGYKLSLVDGKVVSDRDYVVNMVVGDKDSFVILNLTDIQLASSDVRDVTEDYTFAMASLDRLVSAVKPDMITVTGDQCYGERLAFFAVCDKIESFGIPWAPIIGNHDCEQRDITLEEQYAAYKTYPHCLFKDGPVISHVRERNAESLGHYVVNLVRVSDSGFNVVRSLIFMNSGSWQSYDGDEYKGRRRYGKTDYQSLNSSQISWYSDMVRSVPGTPSGLYTHMAPFVFVEAAGEAFNVSSDVFDYEAFVKETSSISYQESFGTACWKPDYEDSYGVLHEALCGAPYDEGLFPVVKELGSTDYIITAHDHVNSFNIRYQGVNLIYAMKTGKSCYADPNMMGATVVTIASDGSASFQNVLDL